MRAMPSFTSDTVLSDRTSSSARSAVWISLRSTSVSSPGLRMESVAMGVPVEDCEKYHIAAPPPPLTQLRIADFGLRIGGGRPLEAGTANPQSAIANPQCHTRDRVLPLMKRASTPAGPTVRNS